MAIQTLLQQQLNNKMKAMLPVRNIPIPATGWVKAIRLALGISSRQLGNKLDMTRQGVQDLERREKEGSITIKSLRDVANALDMELVYGLVPKDGSLEDLINRKATELAKEIVNRTSNTMKLEDQENSKQRIKKAIAERVITIKNEMPKALWD